MIQITGEINLFHTEPAHTEIQQANHVYRHTFVAEQENPDRYINP